VLTRLGVDCVTLANNHALDYGAEALLNTLAHLDAAGIGHVGAGADLEAARAPTMPEADGFRLAVLGCAEPPAGRLFGTEGRAEEARSPSPSVRPESRAGRRARARLRDVSVDL
jgi:poly-gamma-glutamate capsule biosynthesis protein CapA/YwtB (metallophosphatase superfamily)